MKKIEFETFREIGSFEQLQLTQDEPSCFNGFLRIKKYRVTVEEIEEPDEVIRERIQKLWDDLNKREHNFTAKMRLRQVANKWFQ